MDRFHSVILVSIVSLFAFSAIGFSQPDSVVVKVVEKDRTTNLMQGSVFEVHFASGGTDRYEYVTHRETYCSTHPDASGCPPEVFPKKPPIMQNFSFEQTGENPETYRPEESICLEDGIFVRCSGLNRAEIILGELVGQL
ncbi:MAG: hypothetical protein ABEK10_04715 [Candidatus Nanosalina sp.]